MKPTVREMQVMLESDAWKYLVQCARGKQGELDNNLRSCEDYSSLRYSQGTWNGINWCLEAPKYLMGELPEEREENVSESE